MSDALAAAEVGLCRQCRGLASREERAGCEPGMSVPAYRKELIWAARCPRLRSRNGRGAAGRPALAVPSPHALAACSRFGGSGLRPSLAPHGPTGTGTRTGARTGAGGGAGPGGQGGVRGSASPTNGRRCGALHHRGRLPLAAARPGHAPRRPHPRAVPGPGGDPGQRRPRPAPNRGCGRAAVPLLRLG